MSSTDIFKHVERSHADLSKPAKHLKTSDKMAWAYQKDNFDPEVNHKDSDLQNEMNDTLTVLSLEDRFLLSVDNTLASAYNDVFAMSFNERYAQSSIALKGQGRKDALQNVGSVMRSVSIPTTLQKVRRVFSNRAGKETEEKPQEEDVD